MCTKAAQGRNLLTCDELGPLQTHANAAVAALLPVLAASAMDAVCLCEVVPASHMLL